jgi:hypothetical protein
VIGAAFETEVLDTRSSAFAITQQVALCDVSLPSLFCAGGEGGEAYFVTIDRSHVFEPDIVMPTPRAWIALGELYTITFHVIDRPDMSPVGADHFHVLANSR